jgi:hypothetical protein
MFIVKQSCSDHPDPEGVACYSRNVNYTMNTCDPFRVDGVVRMVHYYKHVNPSDSVAAGAVLL